MYCVFACRRMGKKIPGKKHRTVKDPFKQRKKRLESLRLKVDNPPTDPNVQEIPKSLRKIIELKNKAKKTDLRKPKKKRKGSVLLSVAKFLDKEPVHKGINKPDRYIPNVVQKPNEPAENFLKRVNSMTQHLINEVQFERKFGVDIKRNLETGEVVEVRSVKKKKKTSKKEKLSEKRKAKLKEKKENLKEVKEFSQLKDIVEFGEVVHRPPDLSKIKNKKNQTPKEKKFNNLLLNNIVQNKEFSYKNSLSNFEKEKMENERKFIVNEYRKIKRKKLN